MAGPISAARHAAQSATAIRKRVHASAELRLLGSFGLTTATGAELAITSPRTQSLLAYLALRRDRPQPRSQLAFLLWPDSPEAQARNNLRQLLHQLRLGWPDADRFLSSQASAIALHPGDDLTIDVDTYQTAAAAAVAADAAVEASDSVDVRAAFERAADLYRGDLLTGLYEDWLESDRERLKSTHRQLLDRLIGLLEQQADFRAAIERGQQRLRVDPLDERMYRWLMRLHALNQDRAGALRVFHTCASLLEDELGVEPDPVTRAAYEQIVRLGEAPNGDADALPPSGHFSAPVVAPADAGPLVGRKVEWALMMTAWDRMAAGEPHVILLGGEAGIGKSRLAAELCDWARQRGVVTATTRAYAAEGGLSFAPIVDWLRSPALASSLPRLDVTSLSEISRLLPELIARRPDLPRPSARVEDWQRQPFFQALARAFLAADGPLLLILDDIQWCDIDTLEWLHFLLRSDRQARLLLVATYRPGEVDKRHPLAGLIAELSETAQLTKMSIAPLDMPGTAALAAHIRGRELVPAEARHLHVETEGNPLFVVETMRAGSIDSTSGALPAKVHAVIAARLAQLSEHARGLASVAATVGRAFTFDVVREASAAGDDRLVDALDELLHRHMVREHGDNVYDFAHDKIREVAYQEMTGARRRLLHRRVAEALERLNASSLDVIAAQVAAHYANAQLADRAAVYYLRAADVAQRVGANQEAIDLLHRGLAVLDTLRPSLERDARELDLRTSLGVSLVATKGYGAPEVASVYARSRALCQLVGRPASPPILRALALVSLAQAKIDECHALGDHLMSLADRDDDPVLRIEAHYVIGVALLLKGAVVPARAQLEATFAYYDRARSATHISLYSQDPAVVCGIRLSLALYILGDPAAAATRRSDSLTLAAELGHPFTLGYALTWDAIQQQHRASPEAARAQADAAMRLGRDHGMPFWLGLATVVHGWAVAEQGDIESGIEEIRSGMAIYERTGSRSFVPYQLGLLAEQHGRLGNVERGLTLIAEAAGAIERTDERWFEAELLRRKGELLETAARDGEAETAFRHAVDVAHYQGARTPELRSALRLADLWRRQGRERECGVMLRPLLREFDATPDMPEVAAARAFLRRPSHPANGQIQ